MYQRATALSNPQSAIRNPQLNQHSSSSTLRAPKAPPAFDFNDFTNFSESAPHRAADTRRQVLIQGGSPAFAALERARQQARPQLEIPLPPKDRP
jgi:hypothetical protein